MLIPQVKTQSDLTHAVTVNVNGYFNNLGQRSMGEAWCDSRGVALL